MSPTNKESLDFNTHGFDPAIKDQMPQPGDRLGYCRIVDLIAAGGMANVYKVWHEQLEVIRALKILKPGFDEESKNRLETEAKISANLRHSNIVEIYGMGYWNSIPFIEMEYVDGPSLKEVLEKYNRLPITFAISLARALCKSLQFAHRQDLTLYGKVYDGLVHRDIKPANILISSKGIVKLADFGIARPSDVSLHTVDGKVMGTFAYLSPEQLNGDKLDQRADIYSLGAVLYEMLTGAKTFPQKMLAELINRKTKGQYIPVTALCKDIPKQLNASIEKCLSLKMDDRYSDADEFDKDLSLILKKLTSHDPEEIISKYIANPFTISIQHKSNKPLFKLPLKLFLFLFIILIFLSAYLLNKYWDDAYEKRTSTITAVNNHSLPINNAKSTTTATTDIKISNKKSEPHKKVDEIQFGKAVKVFNSGNYLQAISLFERIDVEQLNKESSSSYTVFLLQSYIKTDQVDKALSFSERRISNDGLFFCLRGECYYKKRQYERAEDDFKKARSMPTHFRKNTQKNAALYLARIRDALFMMKPNVDNKQMSIRAWTALLEMYCFDNENISPECKEAREKINMLIR